MYSPYIPVFALRFTPAGEFLFLSRQEKKPKEGDPGRPARRATLCRSQANFASKLVLLHSSAALQGFGVYLLACA